MGADQVIIDEMSQVVVLEVLDFRDLVRGAEAVEEVDERYAARERRRLGDARHVVCFLDWSGGKQPPPGLADGVDVRVIAEDRQCVRGNRPRRYVKDRWCQLAGNLVHARDHEQQALGSGEGGGQRPGLERAVNCRRGATLGLHLDHVGDYTPDVGLALRRPLIGELTHVGGRGDWVDGAHVIDAVCDRRGRFIAVNHHCSTLCHGKPPRSSPLVWAVRCCRLVVTQPGSREQIHNE